MIPAPVLVTGAAGSIGVPLCERLAELGVRPVYATDIVHYDATLDVTNPEQVSHWLETTRPAIVYHLAGFKQAPEGELYPNDVVAINVRGTQNVVNAALRVGARVILASTCKAADPETVYGASKLLAERIVLNARGSVARLYNVPEAAGNVFRLWESLHESEPVPWTDCRRYFLPLDKAVDLFLRVAEMPPGRYTYSPGPSRHMKDIARAHYPDRVLVEVPRRRGDRFVEPLAAACEVRKFVDGDLIRIVGAHDPK